MTNDPTLVFAGTAGAGDVVTVALDGVTLGTATADGAGAWSYDYSGTALADGTYSLTASNADLAGNVATATQAVTVDTQAPVSGPIDITTPTDTGPNDTVTGNGNPVVTFAGGPGLAISVVGADGTTALTPGVQYTVAYAGGAYSVTLVDADPASPGSQPFGAFAGGIATGNPASVADGLYTIKTTDIVGNQSTVGFFEIDTTAPATPTVNAATTVSPQPVVSGTFDAADAAGGLTVTVDGRTYTLGTDAALTAHGNTWTLDLATAGQTLTVKSYDVVVTAADLAGNRSMDHTQNELVIVPVPLPPESGPVTYPDPQLPPSNDTTGPSEPVSGLAPHAPIDDQRTTGDTRTVGDVYTAPGDGAIRIAVIKADEPALFRFYGVPDQNFDTGTHVRFQLPADAFVHTRENAVIRITAERLDGGPLPAWLIFNATTGVFEGDAPDGGPSELEVRVTARDSEGREASTIFRIKLLPGEKMRALGRASLTDQMRQVGSRPAHMDRLAQIDRVSRVQGGKRAA